MNIKDFFLKCQNVFFFLILREGLNGSKSVLDVGCGHNSAIGKIRKNFKTEGIDIYKKSIMQSRKKKNHDSYKIGDIKKLLEFYKNKSFDACVAIDVIEHLNKKDALKLIEDMEAIARKKVVILTPNGFYETHNYDGNPHQVHRSGWKKTDLEKLGYRVFGLRGLKFLRNNHAGIKYKPWFFFGACSFISEIIFFPFPSLSFDLYAVKTISKTRI